MRWARLKPPESVCALCDRLCTRPVGTRGGSAKRTLSYGHWSNSACCATRPALAESVVIAAANWLNGRPPGSDGVPTGVLFERMRWNTTATNERVGTSVGTVLWIRRRPRSC